MQTFATALKPTRGLEISSSGLEPGVKRVVGCFTKE